MVDVTEPIAALTACDLCGLLHVGVWTIVPRGYKPAPREPWRGQGDGDNDG